MKKIADFLDINITNKAVFESNLRSFAHFLLYLCGGAISCILFIIACKKNKYLHCAFFGLIYSILDEIHQIFVPGRAFEVKDIIIDFSGFIIGLGVVALINTFMKKTINILYRNSDNI